MGHSAKGMTHGKIRQRSKKEVLRRRAQFFATSLWSRAQPLLISPTPAPPIRALQGSCQYWALPSWLRRLLPPDINVQWTTSWLKHTGEGLLCQGCFVLQQKEAIKDCTIQEGKRNSSCFYSNHQETHTVNVEKTSVNDPPGYLCAFVKWEWKCTLNLTK